MNIFLQLVIFTASIIILGKSSHLMIKHSIKIARMTRLGDLAVGFIILSILTTTPELMIAIMSVRNQNVEMSVGNIFGSIIVDI